MNQMPRRRIIAAAICLGIVTAGLVYIYLSRQTQQAHAQVQAVAAKRDIVSGTIVDAGMVEIQTFPADALPRAAAVNEESVVGMVVISPIKAGEPISRTQVAPKYRLSHIVPPFMRAVTVALDPIIGVAGFLKPGDHVDVVATFDVNEGTVTKTVLQNVELLATGSEVVAEEIDPETGKPAKPKQQPNATLAVMPTDAEKLILAESKGKLRLTLRGADDISIVHSRGVTGRSVVGIVPPDVPEKAKPSASAPRAVAREPAPLPWQITPLPGTELTAQSGKRVQVIRGSKLEETYVPE